MDLIKRPRASPIAGPHLKGGEDVPERSYYTPIVNYALKRTKIAGIGVAMIIVGVPGNVPGNAP